MAKLVVRMIGMTVLVIVVLVCVTLIGIKLTHRDGVLRVGKITFSPQGDLLAVNGSLNRTFTLAVFDAATKKRIVILDPPSPSWGCMFSPDGQSLISWGEKEITSWETRN